MDRIEFSDQLRKVIIPYKSIECNPTVWMLSDNPVTVSNVAELFKGIR